MKKNITLAICFLACALIDHAQTTTTSPFSSTYSKGDDIASLGIGISSNYFGSGYSAFIPVSSTVSFRHGFTDAISGIGYALYIAGRYYFLPKTVVYAELGYTSLSVLNVGMSFKF